MADRTKNPQRWADVPAAVYDPKERLKAMDEAGIDYAVLYPTVAGVGGQTFGRIDDPELELACVQAYNDWLLEEWAGASERFIPQCITPLYPVDAVVKEIRRCVANGHRGVIYPSIPMELRDVPHINDGLYDPIWATCQELAVPICFHAGASSSDSDSGIRRLFADVCGAVQAITRPASTVSVLVNLLISKILMRFPNLKVVLAESGLGWGAYLVGVHRLSGHRRSVAAERLRSHAVRVVQATVLSGRLVRPSEPARAALCRHGKHSLVEPVPVGDIDLAEDPRGAGARVSTVSMKTINKKYFGRTRRSCTRFP